MHFSTTCKRFFDVCHDLGFFADWCINCFGTSLAIMHAIGFRGCRRRLLEALLSRGAFVSRFQLQVILSHQKGSLTIKFYRSGYTFLNWGFNITKSAYWKFVELAFNLYNYSPFIDEPNDALLVMSHLQSRSQARGNGLTENASLPALKELTERYHFRPDFSYDAMTELLVENLVDNAVADDADEFLSLLSKFDLCAAS